MADIKVVIGANFGDEGKGLMTNYFCEQARKNNQSSIVVLHNGGSQRSHTVSYSPEVRYAFRHLGAGTFQGADTYFAEDFIIDPMNFIEEYWKLLDLAYKNNLKLNYNVFAHKDCMLSFPSDALLNCIKEVERGNSNHGSCGCGIFETINRNETAYVCSISDAVKMSRKQLREIILELRIYAMQNLELWRKENNISHYSIEKTASYYKRLMEDDEIVNRYLDNFYFMKALLNIDIDNKNILNSYSVLAGYDNVIFEGGQGLLLDQNNKEYFPHLTPSNTGSLNPCNIIKYADLIDSDIELCYVTRTYLTRHGAGSFPTECNKNNINSEMHDKTNEPNMFQGTLRYGLINVKELYDRIDKDENNFDLSHKTSLAITHLNETNHWLYTDNGKEKICLEPKYKYYLSSGNSTIQTVECVQER